MNTAIADTSAHPPAFPAALTSSADSNTNYVTYEPAAPIASFAVPDGCVVVHVCTYGETPKRNCGCDIHVTAEDAARLVARGRASEYLYTRSVQGEKVACKKHDAIIATPNLSEEVARIERGEAKKRAELFERRQRERDAAFQKFLPKWSKAVRRSLIHFDLGDAASLPDIELVRAAEDETGAWCNFIPPSVIHEFDKHLSSFWDALLDRENLSIYRGEKAVGATDRTMLFGIDADMSDFVRGEEVDTAGRRISDTHGRRVAVEGSEPDSDGSDPYERAENIGEEEGEEGETENE
jgi:hypothetical protein